MMTDNPVTGFYIHPLKGDFQPGDRVTDLTAEANGWPDVTGVAVEVDGSNVRVRYDSGAERWKIHINLRKE